MYKCVIALVDHNGKSPIEPVASDCDSLMLKGTLIVRRSLMDIILTREL